MGGLIPNGAILRHPCEAVSRYRSLLQAPVAKATGATLLLKWSLRNQSTDRPPEHDRLDPATPPPPPVALILSATALVD